LSRRPPQRIGRYRLVRRIGRGGSGDVYLARLEVGGGVHRLAAIKVLFHTAEDPRHHDALLAEARLGALLCHPNIAQVLDADVEGDLSWFAMEFVPGLSFYELLDVGTGQIPPWISARIVADACAAVHALHEATDEQGRFLGVVHRDVTPHNVLVSWDGNVKLVDLGVAHSALRSSVTTTGVVKGKLGYMSPEQASGAPVDRRCDVFALGVQLWEALAGRRLFKQQNDSETLASIVRGDIPSLRDLPGVPAALADITAAALAVDRAARTPTALDMQRALEAAIGAAGVVVGASDVAQFLSQLTPERVREHVAWLAEVQPQAASPEESPIARQATGSNRARRKRGSNVLIAGGLLGVLATATGLFISRSAADRPTASPRQIAAPASSRDQRNIAAPIVPSSLPPARVVTSPAVVAPGSAGRKPVTSAPTRARSRLPAGVGSLYVSASPTWATIRLDGKPAGTTPTVFSGLAAGTHVVDAQPLGQGPSSRKRVTVEPGGTARVGFEFAEPLVP
jgi:eukaryotic-like serine/threonine-protein kinase